MASRASEGRRAYRGNHKGAVLLGLSVAFLALATAGVVASLAYAALCLRDLPNYYDMSHYDAPLPTVMYASDGQTVLAEFSLRNQEPVAYDQISPLLIEATIAIEDERFYDHDGIDLVGIARALANNVTGGRLEGASTITQQYVRNTVLSSEMSDISLRRKIREAYIALRLEDVFTKEEIITRYLNTINYGAGCYGVEAAAQRYFSQSASDLSLAQAATLAAIPQSPTYNNPLEYPESCLARRNLVLQRMLQTGAIEQGDYDKAVAEPLGLTPTDPPATGLLRYPYFTSYVRNQLIAASGDYALTSDDLYRKGLRVYTTLSVPAQEAAEEAAAAKQSEADAAAGTDGTYECALVAIDPATGHIKALVGGKDYGESQVNLATGEGGAGRQAGSAFKTFTLVAALEQGIRPETLIDASSTVEVPGSTPVSNIDGRNYGVRSIASAYAVSSNTAFVRLIMSIGPHTVIGVAHRMGITTQLPNVAGITLGTEAVTPLEMASAYGTLAAAGVYREPECILRVEDAAGNVLFSNEEVSAGTQAVSPEVARAAIEVMETAVTDGTGYEATLDGGQPVAGKTGTSDQYRDSWFCGITPQLSVAVWLGDRSDYIDAQPVPAGVTAAGAFAAFMDAVLADQPVEDFFEAPAPEYQHYEDAENHVGVYGYS